MAEMLSEGWRQRALVAVMGFILTGVLGTIVTTWIQQRGWVWQNRVAKIDRDTQNALSTYQGASDLINTRWHALYRMSRAIELSAKGDEWRAGREEFTVADKEWAIRYTNVARDVAFYVDTPFGIDARDKMSLVWPMACTGQLVGEGQGAALVTNSARVTLEVINHCDGVIKSDLDVLTVSSEAAAPVLGAEDRKRFAETAFARLDAVYKANETLRCLMFGRALAIRGSSETSSYWNTFFGLAAPTYNPPTGGCSE